MPLPCRGIAAFRPWPCLRCAVSDPEAAATDASLPVFYRVYSVKNMTVFAKVASTFGALALAVLLISAFALKLLADANQRFESYINGINARAVHIQQVREAIDRRAISARNLVLVVKPDDVALEKSIVNEAEAQVTHLLAQLTQDKDVSDESCRLIAEINRIEQAYSPVALGIVDLALKGQHEQAIAKLNDECRPLLAALIKVTDQYMAQTNQVAEALVRQAGDDYATQRSVLALCCLLALALAAAAALLITRNLTRALGAEPADLCDAVSGVAAGNLTQKLQVRSGDEFSVLAAVARMQTSLTRVVSVVRHGAEGVSTSSAEIASGNQDLSSRTEHQASALEQTAASMEQLNSTVKQNADHARQANQLAQSASTVAAQGGQVVSQVVETMKGINDSSRKIADIIGVIDGIAFQTNILALNAAVEAARAGEQGRGFAVVASEVRSLAGRSADAAREIKSLISASVERVEQGTAQVDQAGVTMTEVVSSIRRVTDIVGEISNASDEQSLGVAQVGEAIAQMDRVTQQNAALVEQMAAAAASLKSQAEELVQGVSAFQLDPQMAGPRPTSTAPRSAPRPPAPTAARSLAPSRSRQLPKAPPQLQQQRSPTPAPTVAPKASSPAAADEWETF